MQLQRPAEAEPATATVLLAALLLPFYANDVANIAITHGPVWLAVDYAVRLGVLIFAVWILRRDGATRAFSIARPRGSLIATLIWTAAITGIGVFLISGPGRTLLSLWPETHVGRIPGITEPSLRTIDLSLGLLLVALSEELVFRGIVLPIFHAGFQSAVVALLLSSLLFGLAHWSMGAGAILQTGLAGLALGILTLVTRSVFPSIVAHYVIDLVAFW